jgi:phenylpropionate dioxygenase-like ring-hydroxylating dioxygenase large terminal subunit
MFWRHDEEQMETALVRFAETLDLTENSKSKLTDLMKDVRRCRVNLNYWWPVAQKRHFPDSGLQAVQVGELELVVFKGDTGLFSIFEDACPHRRVRLSQLGRKEKNELVCSYHGWRFDVQSGACRAMPGQPGLRKTFCLKGLAWK